MRSVSYVSVPSSELHAAVAVPPSTHVTHHIVLRLWCNHAICEMPRSKTRGVVGRSQAVRSLNLVRHAC